LRVFYSTYRLPTPTPRFFVSVASKELSRAVSLLSATLAGWAISVADKELKARLGRFKVES